MSPTAFDASQPLLDRLAELAEKEFESAEIRQLLKELAAIVGKNKCASVTLTVDIFDEDRMCSLPLLTTGLSTEVGNEPYRTWGDSSPQRYIVEEGIQVLPQDRCPKCWGNWDFKLQNRSCPHCGITLGDQCKVLLDTHVCPWCEKGKVTIAKPRCDSCGFEVDRQTAVWG